MVRTRNGGFTLIEILVAMAIMAIVSTLVFALFVGQNQAMQAQRETAGMQDNARVAMEVLVRDVRNAGFMLQAARNTTFRVEDDCGNEDNDVGYDPDTQAWTLDGTSEDAMNGGDVLGASIPASTSCPNGSDRLTLVMAPESAAPTTCVAEGCINAGQGDGFLYIPCSGATPAASQAALDATTTAACEATLSNVGLAGKTCAAGGAEYGALANIPACVEGDPYQCISVPVQQHDCVNECDMNGTAMINCVRLTVDEGFDEATWARVGVGAVPDGENIGKLIFAGYRFRSYQIIDVDGDGSTELVYSDRLEEALTSGVADSVDPQWVVVAEGIDDLQVAWMDAAGTATSGTVKQYGNCEDADCLSTMMGGANAPVGLRVSIIARGDRRERDNVGNTVRDLYRGALENNAPAQEVYNPSAPADGCPASNYERCSGNGNAQGFRRRVLTEVITLRNLVGLGT